MKELFNNGKEKLLPLFINNKNIKVELLIPHINQIIISNQFIKLRDEIKTSLIQKMNDILTNKREYLFFLYWIYSIFQRFRRTQKTQK